MKLSKIALAATLLAITSGAEARDWPDAGGFEIVEFEQFCMMGAEYKGPGESRLMVSISRDGRVLVAVDNYSWSAKEDEEYKDISFRLNGTSYGGGTARGIVDGIRKGFMIGLGEGFLKDFTASTYFHIYKGEQIIDRLDLDGSAVAVAAVKRCVAHVDGLRRGEERERKKYEDLPKDPFAKNE